MTNLKNHNILKPAFFSDQRRNANSQSKKHGKTSRNQEKEKIRQQRFEKICNSEVCKRNFFLDFQIVSNDREKKIEIHRTQNKKAIREK
ncbi:MAG: hypothetical protein H7836_17510 [Magnetococcus sp. YQC-3]